MADTTLTPAQQLHALLSPTTPEGQEAVEKNETLRRLSGTYRDMLANTNPNDMETALGKIVRELNSENLFEPQPDRVWKTFDTKPFDQPKEPSPETPAPKSPTLADFLPVAGNEKNKGSVMSQADLNPDMAKKKLLEAQKNATLQAFQELLEKNKDSDNLPQLIDEFYHTHLSAAGVVGKQYDILLAQTRKLYGGKDSEFDKKEDALRNERDEAIAAQRKIHGNIQGLTAEELARRRKEEAQLARLKGTVTPNGIDYAAARKAAEDAFNSQWIEFDGSAVLASARRLFDYRYFYSTTYEEGYTSYTSTVFHTEEPQEVESGYESAAGGGSGSHGGGQLRNQARNLEKKGVKKAEKELGKKLGEEAVEGAGRALGTAAADAALDTAVATSETWVPAVAIGCAVGCAVVIAIAIITVAVIVIFTLISNSQKQQRQQQQQLQQARCIDTDADNLTSVPSVLSLIKNKFHVTITGDLASTNNATDPTSLAESKKLFQYTCMLFGHTNNSPNPKQFNTFGNAVTLFSDNGLSVIVDTSTTTAQTCSAAFVKQTGSSITWSIKSLLSCSEGKQRFIIGKAYADIAVRQLRQEKIRNRQSRQNVFDTFTVQFAKEKPLPTDNCSTTKGSERSLACFSDLVGSYFSYPLYFDSSGTKANFLALVSDFANYYFFAKDKLFDNVEFFHAGHPTPPGYPADLRSAIQQTFGITINGMNNTELKWAWEKLWDVSNTKFIPLVRNGHVTIFSTPGGTAYTHCDHGSCDVHLHEFNNSNSFDVIFTHELGHVISFMNPDSDSHRSEIPKAIIFDAIYPPSLAGWMTYYSELACLYHPPTLGAKLGEDYAETIAYYLNPKSDMLTACGGGPNPYANGNHPQHFLLAQKILGLY